LIDSIITGMQTAFLPVSLLFTALGVAIGILGGAMPGINGAITTALVLPFTFHMEPEQALMLLLGIYIGVQYGGSIPAILIGTPGTPAAGATLIDGFPLRQQGKAGLALYTSLVSSSIGTIISGFVLILIALPLAKAALSFGPAEYFALGVLGLTMIVSLSEENIFKGLFAGALGLLLSTVGMDEFLGVSRFGFGLVDLASGIDPVPAMMGFFALGQMFMDFWKPPQLESVEGKVKMKRFEKGVFRRLLPTTIFSGIIGVIIGALPGTGASVASFVAYNQVKQMSKNSHEFGSGRLEGVAASEAANNGVTGGALIPMLGLGIPGSGTTAVMLSALIIHGVTPGPNLFISNPEIPYSMFITVFSATLFMFLFGLLYTRLFLRIVLLPQSILNSTIVLIVLTGAYAVERDVFDIILVLLFGFISYLLRRCKIPITPIILGLVLGGTVERSMRRALIISHGSWSTFFIRPISCIMFILAALTLVAIIWKTYIKKGSSTGSANKDEKTAKV